MSDLSPAQRSVNAWNRISDILDEVTQMPETIRCWTCREEWDETDMVHLEWHEGPTCPECRDREIEDSMPTMSEMAALTLASARLLCSGCSNRHDPDDCPYYG